MTPATELRRAEQLLMTFPMSIRLRRKVQALRQVVAQQEARQHQHQEERAQALRGLIRRSLCAADVQTLERVVRVIGGVA